jgi:hypothetical protein
VLGGGIGCRREGRKEKEDTEVYDEDFISVLSCKYRLGDQIEEDKCGRDVISTEMRKKITSCAKITTVKYLGKFYTEKQGKWEIK